MCATASCLSRLGQGLRNLWTGLDEGLHGCLQGLGLTWILLKIGGGARHPGRIAWDGQLIYEPPMCDEQFSSILDFALTHQPSYRLFMGGGQDPDSPLDSHQSHPVIFVSSYSKKPYNVRKSRSRFGRAQFAFIRSFGGTREPFVLPRFPKGPLLWETRSLDWGCKLAAFLGVLSFVTRPWEETLTQVRSRARSMAAERRVIMVVMTAR